MTDLIVIDVADYQGVIDWPAVVGSLRSRYGGAAAIVKAGSFYANGANDDNQWTRNAAGAATADWWGAYQYLGQNADPAAAARHLQAQVLALPADRRPNVIVLDLEEGTGDQSSRQKTWHDALNTGIDEWDYSGAYFIRAHNLQGVEWVAAYSSTEPSLPHDLWQYTGGGYRVAGIAGGVDASKFHGTIDQLKALTGDNMANLQDNDPDWLALIYREEAEVMLLDKFAGGPPNVAGQPVPLTAAIKGLQASVKALKTELDAVQTKLNTITTVTATVDVEAVAAAVVAQLQLHPLKPS